MTPTEEFEDLLKRTVLASGLEKMVVGVPLTIPFYKKKSFAWVVWFCGAALWCVLCKIGWGNHQHPEALGVLFIGLLIGFGSFFNLLFGPWETEWLIVAKRHDSMAGGYFYEYLAKTEGVTHSSKTLMELLEADGRVTPEQVAEAFSEALAESSSERILLANNRLAAGLARHKIVQDLEVGK